MSANAVEQVLFCMLSLLALSVPLGHYLARVYQGEATFAQRVLGPLERLLYRLCRVDPAEDMPWTRYALAVLLFNLAGTLLVYALLRTQSLLPLNPAGLGPVPPWVAFNTAVSFATNTNWQAYGGETTLSHFSQMVALTVQNFVSAGTGMAVLVAVARGFSRAQAQGVGSFWVDLTRSTLYVLLPLSLLVAAVLVSQGVVQTLSGAAQVHTLEGDSQTLALGPAASQVAIKQLGTNGGGFFNANSAHPFENSTPLSNFVQWLSILLIPTALCFTFGKLVKDPRQGRTLLAAMLVIFVPLVFAVLWAEQRGTPMLSALGVDSAQGNMEGKETRFGVTGSALWAVATTAASNGSVNSMHDSFTPLGGLVPMWLMQLGEIVFGGVGSGLYGLLVYALVAVFIAGLMVGRTPEYLGKKVESFEMKMASLAVLVPAAAVLLGTAVGSVTEAGTAPLGNPGMHGFSEILYAFSSGSNNNGSAFGGLTASGPFYAAAIGVVMWLGRFWVLVPVLAIAGSLAKKRSVPVTPGTLPTHTPLFVALLVGTVLLVGALTFVPALALGPVAEELQGRSTP